MDAEGWEGNIPRLFKLELNCLRVLKCHFGRCHWGRWFFMHLLRYCKPENLNELYLTYPRRVADISPHPMDILQQCGRHLKKLSIRPIEPLLTTMQCLTEEVRSHEAPSDVKEICPMLEAIGLNRLSKDGARFIGDNFASLSLDCRDLTLQDFLNISEELAEAGKLRKLILHRYGEPEVARHIEEVKQILDQAGWKYAGISYYRDEAMFFVRKKGLKV